VDFTSHIDLRKICTKFSDLMDIYLCSYNSIKNQIKILITDFERFQLLKCFLKNIMTIVYIFEKVEVNFLKLKDHLELALRRPNSKLRISGKNNYETMF